MIKPKKLKRGDTIALIAPSGGLGGLFPYRVDTAKKALEELGFKVKEFPTAKRFVDGNAGTSEERVADIHAAFADPEVKAIICVIGGISCNELLNSINYDIIKNNPKIFCGYSDITLLHYAINKKVGLVTFYGPAAMTQFGEFPKPLKYTVEYFLKALTRAEPIGKIDASTEWTDELLDWAQKKDLTRPRKLNKNKGYTWLKSGKANGKIFGGCLYSILQLRETQYNVDYKDKILFIENPEGQDFTKGEPLSHIDSQIMDLRNSGVFDKIKGLIVGRGFGYTEEEMEKFRQIIAKHVKSYKFPVLFNVDIGHTDPIITLPLDVTVNLDSSKNEFKIEESGVL